ncbi:MAG: hypothetical protein IKB07_13755 [Lachnospiraceae bacterium]|nr:hypothetical protein [Lachnospiraceae bacterium]
MGAAVESIGEVTVTRLYPTATEVYEYPVNVKSATLNKDDKSKVNVELFSNLADKTNYIVTVPGYEPYTLTAVAGVPDSIQLSAKADGFSPFVEIDGEKTSEIFYTLYCGTVDVTEIYKSKGNLLLNAETFSTDGTYFVSGNQIWFSDENLEVTVLAEFQSHEYKDGAPVISVKDSETFISKAKDPIVIKKIETADLTNKWYSPSNKVPFDGNYYPLQVKLTYSDGTDPVWTSSALKIDGRLEFESLSTETAVVAGSDVRFFKQGKATIIVYHVTMDNTGKENWLPVGTVVVEATAPRTYAKFDLSTSSLTMGANTAYDTASISITAKNNYEEVLGAEAYSVNITGTDKNATAALNGVTWSETGINLNATDMLAGVCAYNGKTLDTAQVTFKVTVTDAYNPNNKTEKTFTVLIKKQGKPGTEYVDVVTKGFGADIARTNANDNTKKEKTASFSVLEMSNGVQIGFKTLEKYNKNDTSNVTVGGYYYTVTRDGQDVTNDVDYADGVITLNFSDTEVVTNAVNDAGASVAVSKVVYPLKAGNYVFTLYEGMSAGQGAVAVQRRSAAGSVTCNTGSYSFAGKNKDVIANDNPETIRAAFKFNMTNSQNATTPFSVDSVTAGDYVNVKSITFYDEVATGVYAPYTVNLGVTLKIDQYAQ